jgi:hypothetical protein
MSEQTSTPPADMKQCPYCGKMTSAKANFCYWCTRELAARPERPESPTAAKPLRLPSWLWILAAVIVAAGIIAVLVLR